MACYKRVADVKASGLPAQGLIFSLVRFFFLPGLQRLLGHDRLTTTQVYLNLSPEEVLPEFWEKW